VASDPRRIAMAVNFNNFIAIDFNDKSKQNEEQLNFGAIKHFVVTF
jgi:hypothetical protein